jgi:stringent starvation protein B
MITCTGRFSGASFELMIPVHAVIGIFAKETGQGLVFQGEPHPTPPSIGEGAERPKPHKPVLKIVK